MSIEIQKAVREIMHHFDEQTACIHQSEYNAIASKVKQEIDERLNTEIPKVASVEELVALFESIEYNGGGSAFAGLVIIAKYADNERDMIRAEHDEIYSLPGDSLIAAGITIEDATKLRELGWCYDTDADCLSHFV